MMMIPEKDLLVKTGDIDYFDWNYRFPIRIIQRYRFKRIVKLLGTKRYGSILEAGTGSGIFIPELSKHCESLFACDIHSNFDHINRLFEQYNIRNCEISSQNLENTTYSDQSFDAIVAVSVLEFINDIPKAISEIKRLLKPGGVFITICPMENKLLDFVVSCYTHKRPGSEFGDSRKYVGKMLEENFRVIEKGYMIPVIGKILPIYTHYKLMLK